jgi:hypothetical protein
MACPYLPDGCTQADLDSYYGSDQYDPRDEEDPLDAFTEDEISLFMTMPDPEGEAL